MCNVILSCYAIFDLLLSCDICVRLLVFWTACAMSITPFWCCRRGRMDKFLYIFQALFHGELKASAMRQKLQALTTSKRGNLQLHFPICVLMLSCFF
jgi:hypothetical protein